MIRFFTQDICHQYYKNLILKKHISRITWFDFSKKLFKAKLKSFIKEYKDKKELI